MELVHGATWMRTAIARFAELIQPLQNLLESQYSMHKTGVKSKIRGRPFSAWRANTKLPLHPSFRRSLSKSYWRKRTLRNAYSSSQKHLRHIVSAFSLKLVLLKLQHTPRFVLNGITLLSLSYLAYSAHTRRAGPLLSKKAMRL